MTDVAIVAGEQLLIKIGDGGSPEAFTHTCLINAARGVAFKTNLTTTEVADCADQSKPAKIIKKAKSIDFTVTGAGKTDAGSVYAFLLWWQSGLPKNIIIDQNLTGAAGGFSGAGQAILSDFKLEGTRGDYQDFTCTIDAAEPFTWSQNA